MTKTKIKSRVGVYRETEIMLPKRRLDFDKFKRLAAGLGTVLAIDPTETMIASGCNGCLEQRTHKERVERTTIEQVIRRVECVERTREGRIQLKIGGGLLPTDQRPRMLEDRQNCNTVRVQIGDRYQDEVRCQPKQETKMQLRRPEFGLGTFQAQYICTIPVNRAIEHEFRRYDGEIAVVRQLSLCDS